jgi:hypothetical protein
MHPLRNILCATDPSEPAEELRSPPTNPSTIGDATGTSALAVVYNIDLHQRRRSPTSQLAADPLPPPCPRLPLVDDDDDPQPPDLHLIQPPTFSRTVSVSFTH